MIPPSPRELRDRAGGERQGGGAGKIESRRQFLSRTARDPAAAYRAVGATYRPDDERLLEKLEPVVQLILDVRAMRCRHPSVTIVDVPLLLGLVNDALDEFEAVAP
jgi:hypothetical protein